MPGNIPRSEKKLLASEDLEKDKPPLIATVMTQKTLPLSKLAVLWGLAF